MYNCFISLNIYSHRQEIYFQHCFFLPGHEEKKYKYILIYDSRKIALPAEHLFGSINISMYDKEASKIVSS